METKCKKICFKGINAVCAIHKASGRGGTDKRGRGLVPSHVCKELHSWRGSAVEIKTADLCVVSFTLPIQPHFNNLAHVLYSQATKALQRKKAELNYSRSFHTFPRQIISGLCPLAPTLCPSCFLWPVITCHSFDLFISSTLGWIEANGNPLISGSWLYSLYAELWSRAGKRHWSRGNWGNWGEILFSPKTAHLCEESHMCRSLEPSCHNCVHPMNRGGRVLWCSAA